MNPSCCKYIIYITTQNDTMEDGSTSSDINNSMTRNSNDTSTGDNNTMNSVIGGRRGESSITDIVAADDDVIEIDAGGKIIRALRSTLTLAPDTMFTFMFSVGVGGITSTT